MRRRTASSSSPTEGGRSLPIRTSCRHEQLPRLGRRRLPGNDGTTIVLDAPDATRDVIIKFFQQTGTLDPKADGNWSLRPVAGARNVVFESSPKAKAVMPKGVAHIGDAANGFARYKLDLSA